VFRSGTATRSGNGVAKQFFHDDRRSQIVSRAYFGISLHRCSSTCASAASYSTDAYHPKCGHVTTLNLLRRAYSTHESDVLYQKQNGAKAVTKPMGDHAGSQALAP